jgi:hypothetical protein
MLGQIAALQQLEAQKGPFSYFRLRHDDAH